MNKKYKFALPGLVVLLFIIAAGWYLTRTNIAVLEPKGTIGQQERHLIVTALLLSLVVVIPVFTMLFAFAWRYRENAGRHVKYSPDWDHNAAIEAAWWFVPSVLILILSVITWNSSHQLDPYKPLAGGAPLQIQVVALDWKWLFIYPKQNIASVNLVQFPEQQPIDFEITADAPMNSFWIPQLGGQIYAMPGMSTELHLMANQAGSYYGSSANISGSGFADMSFTAKASTEADFNSWAKAAKRSNEPLSLANYNKLSAPSQYNPVKYYSAAQPGLYYDIMAKFMVPTSSSNGPKQTADAPPAYAGSMP